MTKKRQHRPRVGSLVAALGAAFLACGKPPPPPPPGCDPAATEWTVWVTNQGVGVDTVTVLRNHDEPGEIHGEVLATIKVGRAPHNIVLSPDGRYAYTANLGTPPARGTISVIDTRTYQVVATVEGGVKCHGLAVAPDGREVWIVNENSNDVTIVDTASWQAQAQTVGVGTGPLLAAFVSGGAKAYVSNGKAGTASVVDVASRKAVKSIATGKGAMGLTVRADGRLVFETEGLDNRVSVIDVESDEVVNVLTYDGTLVEPHGVAVAGNDLLITNRTGQSLVFADSRTLEKVASLEVLGRPDIIAVSPDCRRAYFTLRDRPGVAVVDVPERKLLGAIDMGAGDTHGIAVLRAGK